VRLFAKAQLERLDEHARRLHIPWHEAEDILQRSLEKLWLHRGVVDRPHWKPGCGR
jgi:DNA-directed RNA polymerase specialized sigma24 family protein